MSLAATRAVLAVGFLTAAAVAAALIVWLASAGPGVAETEPDGAAMASAETSPARGAVAKIIYGDGKGGIDHIVDLTTASSAQAAALDDEYVTRDEYEAAVWAAWECSRDAGYEALGEPHWDAGGTSLTYSFVSKQGAVQAFMTCRDTHSELVESTWAWQNRPSVEQTAAAVAAMRTCLIEVGYPEAGVAAEPPFIDLSTRDEHYGRCLREVSIEFKVGWYAGD